MRVGLLFVLLALSINACALPPVNAVAMNSSDSLALADGAQRAGIRGIQLGDERDSVMAQLALGGWQLPVCESGVTALRGTGRLFMIEQCMIMAKSELRLADQLIERIDTVLLDSVLVRLDIRLRAPVSASESSSESSSESASTAPTALLDLLHSIYAAASEPRQWHLGDDQVRLIDEQQLQMIDGRLERKLPALFENRFELNRQ